MRNGSVDTQSLLRIAAEIRALEANDQPREAIDKARDQLRAECATLAAGDARGTISLQDPCGVAIDNVHWLWPGYASLGHVTGLSARYGCGKSTAAVDIARRVIQGAEYPLGGGNFEPGRVLYVHPDEPAADVRRRFYLSGLTDSEAHGGLRLLANGPGAVLDLRRLWWLESAVEQWEPDLVILDTLGDLDLEGDLQKPGPGKAVTARLATVAERSGAAILALGHIRKGAHGRHDAVYGAGSVPGSFRSGFIIRQRAPDDPEADESDAPGEFGVYCYKASYAAVKPKPFGFTIGGADFGGISGGVLDSWRTDAGFREEDSLDFPRKAARIGRGDVEDWLRERLRPGPEWTREVEADAPEGATDKLLRKARSALKVRRRKVGKCWAVYLPQDAAGSWDAANWAKWAESHDAPPF